MQLGQLLNPFIRKFQTGGDTSIPEGFEFLSGLEGSELERYLESKFGVEDASDTAQYFDSYDTSGEEALQRKHKLGMGSAQMTAGAKMGDIFSKARAAGSKGASFGGRARAMQGAQQKTFSGLKQQQAKLGESLATGLYGEKEQFMKDFGSTVTGLGQYDVGFKTAEDMAKTAYAAELQEAGCSPGERIDENGQCIPAVVAPDNLNYDETNCPEGMQWDGTYCQYMGGV